MRSMESNEEKCMRSNLEYFNMKILLLVLLLIATPDGYADKARLKDVDNLQKIAKLQKETHRVIILYVSSSDCVYCVRLEEDIIQPLIISGDYDDKVLLRKVSWESSNPLINFSGVKQIPADFLLKYKIIATPTLLFLKGDGTEASKRITGYHGDFFFWDYLDKAIDSANKKI